ncbi:AEC family transporter [Ruminococcus sp.]|uniref:AEC family transporter n=1 Tax=Ruminococcus sp. TaxID=41978 RepID=UPI0025F35FDD|nr:AEC family transporter [Ruminococcus sp.]
MENLVFSLNATLPIFALMVLGNVFRRLSLIDDKAASWMNKFVFKIALPVLVFEDLADQDFAGTWNGKFVAFCFLATSVSIVLIYLLSTVVIRDKSRRGEFMQGAYRSSAALLGIAFIRNIYGDSATGMGPLMILGSVPLYNVFAVIILTLTAEKDGDSEGMDKKALAKSTFKGIITNPIIIGIGAGLLFSLLKVPKPAVADKIISDIGALATPLGLMSMGATFDFRKAVKNVKPALLASFIKLFVLVAIFLPIAVRLGFAGEQIVAILVMLGSATTVSCYIMAKSMGHEGTLSSSIIMMTTFGCSFSLTFWLFVLRSFGVI